MKEILTEQVIAGSLLLFDQVSKLDISLISEQIRKTNPNYIVNDIDTYLVYLNNYVDIKNDTYSIHDNLNLNSNIKKYHCKLKKRLEDIAGKEMQKFFKHFDISQFLLRKVEYYGEISLENIDSFFGKTQLEKMKSLIQEGYLQGTINKENIQLSKLGKLKLYKEDKQKEIQFFKNLIERQNYDTSLLDDFLITQDLFDSTHDHLKFSKYIEYLKEDSNLQSKKK